MARISVLNGLWKVEFTYHLSQDNQGENVSVQWLMKNQIHVPSKPGQPRWECERSVAHGKWMHVPPKPGHSWLECQFPEACRKIECTYPLSQDNHGRNVGVQRLVKKNLIYAPPKQGKIMARMSAFSGLWKIKLTYALSEDNHSEDVSIQ